MSTRTEVIQIASSRSPLVRRSSLETIKELRLFLCSYEWWFPALKICIQDLHSSARLGLLQLLLCFRPSRYLPAINPHKATIYVGMLTLVSQVLLGVALVAVNRPPLGLIALLICLFIIFVIAIAMFVPSTPVRFLISRKSRAELGKRKVL